VYLLLFAPVFYCYLLLSWCCFPVALNSCHQQFTYIFAIMLSSRQPALLLPTVLLLVYCCAYLLLSTTHYRTVPCWYLLLLGYLVYCCAYLLLSTTHYRTVPCWYLLLLGFRLLSLVDSARVGNFLSLSTPLMGIIPTATFKLPCVTHPPRSFRLPLPACMH
jgi:hypothetical protein